MTRLGLIFSLLFQTLLVIVAAVIAGISAKLRTLKGT